MSNNGINPYVLNRLMFTDPPARVSRGERELLARLVEEDAQDSGDQLTLFVPGGWWIGSDQVDGRICFRLIRHCFISAAGDMSGGVQYWRVNETGREALLSTTRSLEVSA